MDAMRPSFLRKTWIAAVTAALLAGATRARAADPAIEFLLHSVETSTATFIRNGKAHKGFEAAEHMRTKAKYFSSRIHSPEDFIRVAATKSALSHQPYLIQEGTAPVRSDEWMRRKLEEYRHP